MNYEKDLKIDVDALDVEWADHAELSLQYGKHYANCMKELEEAEEDIKITRSELIKKANEDPEGCLGDDIKPTAPNVEAYYRNHRRHKKAKTRIIVSVGRLL